MAVISAQKNTISINKDRVHFTALSLFVVMFSDGAIAFTYIVVLKFRIPLYAAI